MIWGDMSWGGVQVMLTGPGLEGATGELYGVGSQVI